MRTDCATLSLKSPSLPPNWIVLPGRRNLPLNRLLLLLRTRAITIQTNRVLTGLELHSENFVLYSSSYLHSVLQFTDNSFKSFSLYFLYPTYCINLLPPQFTFYFNLSPVIQGHKVPLSFLFLTEHNFYEEKLFNNLVTYLTFLRLITCVKLDFFLQSLWT